MNTSVTNLRVVKEFKKRKILRAKSPGRKLASSFSDGKVVIAKTYHERRWEMAAYSSNRILLASSSDLADQPAQKSADLIEMNMKLKNYKFNCILMLSLMFLTPIGVLCKLCFDWETYANCHKQHSVKIYSESLLQEFNYITGQDDSISMLKDNLKKFDDMGFPDNLMFMWWVGPVGVGKSKLSKGFQKVHGIVVHKYFDELISPIENFADKTEYLRQKLDPCKPNVIILDGYDSGQSSFIRLLKFFLNALKSSSSNDTFKKVLIILLGSYHSEIITKAYIDHIQAGHTRGTFAIDSLKTLLHQREFFSIPSIIIPFLPLESYHLKYCVNLELAHLFSNETKNLITEFLINAKLISDEIVEGISLTTGYFPKDSKLLLSMGCKHVSSHLKKVLANLDIRDIHDFYSSTEL